MNQDETINLEKNLPIRKAARLLGKSEQFIRIGLRNKRLPFGTAVKLSTQWTYHISPRLFYEYIGLLKIDSNDEEKTKEAQSENNLSIAGSKCFALHHMNINS